MSPPVSVWLLAFVWTLALELPIYALSRLSRWRLAVTVLAIELATHPALTYLAPRFRPFWWWFLVCESVVALAEGLLLAAALRLFGSRRPGLARSLGIAAGANAFSALSGLVLVHALPALHEAGEPNAWYAVALALGLGLIGVELALVRARVT